MSALRDALRDLPDAVFADLLESDDAYLLVIDLPGATAETVDVRVEDLPGERRVGRDRLKTVDGLGEVDLVGLDRRQQLDAEFDRIALHHRGLCGRRT